MSPLNRTPRWIPDPNWTGEWTLPPVLLQPVCALGRTALLAAAVTAMGPKQVCKLLASVNVAGELLDLVPALRAVGCNYAQMLAAGVRLVLPCDAEYPQLLLETKAPPPMLFVRGIGLDQMLPAVAIVGSRGCTSSGRRFAARVAAACAARGLTVVSGLARGIDGAAHAGALETGRTIAVLGSGIDRIYPPEHSRLAEAVAADGAIMSEFAPGAEPRAWHFPARNRIIAGMTLGTVVVEAGTRSGALITASMAYEEGREVHACLVAPDNPAGVGVREMLRDGVGLVADPDDYAAEMVALAGVHGHFAGRCEDLQVEHQTPEGPLAKDRDAYAVWNEVLIETTIDDIVLATDLSIGRIRATLAALELDGFVRQVGSDRWSRP